MSDIEEIREAVDQAKAPGTFNIAAVLKERAYPKMEVSVSMDEQAAYEASVIKEKLEKIDLSWARAKKPDDVSKEEQELLDQQEQLMQKIKDSSFVFYLEGVSEGKRNELLATARKKYPVEYEQDVDFTTGKMEKVEKESPERDSLYTDLLWEAHIKKIVNNNGDEQVGVSYSDVRAMRDNMPISAIGRINECIEKLRVATAVFMLEADEDFLAKSSRGTTSE